MCRTGAELAHGLRKTKTHFYAPWDHMPIHIKGGSIIPTQVFTRFDFYDKKIYNNSTSK